MENDRSLPQRKSRFAWTKKRTEKADVFSDSKSAEKFIYIVINKRREVAKRRKSFTVQFPVRKKSLSRNLKLNGRLFLYKTKDSYSSFDGKNKTLALG